MKRCSLRLDFIGDDKRYSDFYRVKKKESKKKKKEKMFRFGYKVF